MPSELLSGTSSTAVLKKGIQTDFLTSNYTLSFEIIKDLSQAEYYWKMFSPNSSLFENWEFRYCAHKYSQFELFFYVGFLNGEPIGLLPLEWNSQKLYLEFFGGRYMEDNRVFTKSGFEEFAPAFFNQVTLPMNLRFIKDDGKGNTLFEADEHSYYVSTKFLTTYEDFINLNFKHPKKRSEFKRVLRGFKQKHSVEVLLDNHEDIGIMFEYSLKNFEDRCDLVLHPSESKFELDLLNEFDAHLLTFVIDGKKQAVSLVLIFNGVLYGINNGINYSDVNNLGKFVFSEKLSFAISHNLVMYHAGAGSFNWKEDWHLDKFPQFKLEKK